LRRLRVLLSGGLAVALALLVLASGLESAWHAHVPHATVASGAALHSIDDNDNDPSCSFCRLAHQVSAVPTVPAVLVRPVEPDLRPVPIPAAHTALGIATSCSPRAPPASPVV